LGAAAEEQKLFLAIVSNKGSQWNVRIFPFFIVRSISLVYLCPPNFENVFGGRFEGYYIYLVHKILYLNLMHYLIVFLHCKFLPHENYGDWELRGPCRENLLYLWKRVAKITKKPYVC
jgi:hypothetical protein